MSEFKLKVTIKVPEKPFSWCVTRCVCSQCSYSSDNCSVLLLFEPKWFWDSCLSGLLPEFRIHLVIKLKRFCLFVS